MKSKPDEHAAERCECGRLLSEWMTLDELAKELGVHKETLRTWHRERRGPPFARVGLRRLYRRDAVREWLRNLEVPS
jgi:excisionase family DNA binding protein